MLWKNRQLHGLSFSSPKCFSAVFSSTLSYGSGILHSCLPMNAPPVKGFTQCLFFISKTNISTIYAKVHSQKHISLRWYTLPVFLVQQVAPILFPSPWQLQLHNSCVLTQNIVWFGIAGWDVLHICPADVPKTVSSSHSVYYRKKNGKQISLSTLVWLLLMSLLDSFFQPVKAEWWTAMRG